MATKLPFRSSIEAVTSAKQNDCFIRQLAAFTIALLGGLALAMTPGGRGCPHKASPESASSMTHISSGTIACGVETGEIAKFQKIFSVTVAQLFEEIVPKHKVRVPSFWIDKYLVTNSQLKKFVDGRPDWQAGKVPAELDNGSYPPNSYGIYDRGGNVWKFQADEWGKYPLNPANTTPNEFSSPRTPFREVRSRRVIRGGSFELDPINLWVEYRDSHPPNGSQPFVRFRCAKGR